MFGANSYGSIYYGQSYPGLTIEIPVWVSPGNHATNVSGLVPFVFILPQAQAPMHFELQYDTGSGFNTGNLVTVQSWVSQTRWEYHDGSTWQAFPSGGVPVAYAGNQARYTVPSALAATTWYRRIRGRVRV
jgi:hypothetical protein